MKSTLRATGLLAFAFLCVPPLRAQTTLTWADNTTDFAAASSWLESVAPADNLTTHIASFGLFFTTRQPFLSTNRSVAGVAFVKNQNANITNNLALIDSGLGVTLTLGASGLNNANTTGTQTVTLGLALGAQANFTNEGTLSLEGPVNNGGFFLRLTGGGAGGTLAGVLSGAGGLFKSGAGTWNLTGANTYTGGSFIDFGTLQLGSAGALGSSGTLTLRGGTLRFSASNTTDYSARFAAVATQAFNFDTNGQAVTLASALISSGGTLTKLGAGTLTLSGANTYDGGTAINAGILALGSSGALGPSGTISFGGGTLQLTSSNTTDYSARFSTAANQAYAIDTNGQSVTFGGALTSSGGTLTKSGAGTLTLSGANTYTGGTTVSGGTFALGAFNDTVGAVTLTSGALTGTGGVLTGSAYAVESGTVSAALAGAGALTKSTAGTVTLSGANTYTGGTAVNAGTLALGSSGALGSTGAISFAGGTLQFSASNATDYSARFAAVASQAFNFDTNGQAVTLASALASSGGTLTKLGAGTLTLSGANTYTGATTISAGTLQIGAGGTSGSVAGGSIVNHAALAFNRGDALTYSGVISGGGSLTKLGAGTLTLSGASTYAGGTTVSAGTLALGASNRLPDTGALAVSGGTFALGAFNDTVGAVTLTSGALTGTGGVLTGSAYAVQSGTVSATLGGGGSLTKSTAGTVTLSGANTYTGGTTISAGTLALGASHRLPDTGTLTVSGGTLSLGAFSDTVSALSLTSGSITGTGTLTAQAASDLQSGTISANLTFSSGTFGVPGLTKSGGGTVTLTGNAAVSNGTTISGGSLQVGNGGLTGSLDSGAVSLNGGNLTFNRSDDVTFANNISGASVNGSGVVNAGTGNVTLTGSLAMGDVAVTGSGTMTLASAITPSSGADLVKSGGGTLITSSIGAPKLWVNAGAVRLDSGNGLNNANVAAGASLVFNHSVFTTLSGVISGAGSWSKSGSGTLRLAGDNTNNGGLTVTGGLVQFSTLANLGNGSVTLNGGGLLWEGASTIDVSSRLGALGASGGTFNTNGNNVTFASTLNGAGALTKTGGGTLTLSGANTYTGGTAVNAGTLALGSPGALGSNGAISFGGGTLQFSAGNTTDYSARFSAGAGQAYNFDTNGQSVTLAQALTSSGGALTKSGAGTLTLSGANTAAGATTISGGTLQIGAGGTTGSVAGGSIVNHAALAFNRGDALTYSGVISGAGALTKLGAGTLTLSGANTYTGATTINAGQIKLDGSAPGSAFTVNGGILSGGGTVGALTIASGGSLAPGNSPGTLSAGATTFAGGGAFNWELNSTAGTAGADPGWDLLSISGALNLTATSGNPFTINLTSLTLGNVAGEVSDFSASANYAFTFVTTTGGISGFATEAFDLDTSAFQNPFTGNWSIAQSGNNLTLNYTGMSAIPEPSTYAAWAGAVALGFAAWQKRRRQMERA